MMTLKAQALAIVLWLVSMPAFAGAWNEGDKVTVPVVCDDKAPLETVLEMATQSVEMASGALGMFIASGDCFMAPSGRGYIVNLSGLLKGGTDIDGDQHQLWSVTQDARTGYVLILTNAGPHRAENI